MLENPFFARPGPVVLPAGAVASAGGKRPVESGGTDEPAEKRQKVGITGRGCRFFRGFFGTKNGDPWVF